MFRIVTGTYLVGTYLFPIYNTHLVDYNYTGHEVNKLRNVYFSYSYFSICVIKLR